MSRYIIPVVLVLLFIPFLMIGLTKDPSELPSTFLNKPAPEFDLPSLLYEGQRVNNERSPGKWCSSISGQPGASAVARNTRS